MRANNMKTIKKTSGFFIVEILIVLVIVGILVAALLPNLATYTNRAKFVDVINAAGAVRHSVDACFTQIGTVTGCSSGAYGIPNTPGAAGNFSSYTVTNGVINATSTAALGSYTYVLTPTATNNQLTWAVSGTC